MDPSIWAPEKSNSHFKLQPRPQKKNQPLVISERLTFEKLCRLQFFHKKVAHLDISVGRVRQQQEEPCYYTDIQFFSLIITLLSHFRDRSSSEEVSPLPLFFAERLIRVIGTGTIEVKEIKPKLPSLSASLTSKYNFAVQRLSFSARKILVSIYISVRDILMICRN